MKVNGESTGLFIHCPWHLPPLSLNSNSRTLTPTPTTTSFAVAAINAIDNQNIYYNGIYPLPLPGQLLADVTKGLENTLPQTELPPFQLDHLEYVKSINSTLLAQIEENSSLSTQLPINKLPSLFGSLYNKSNGNYISKGLHNKLFQRQTAEASEIISEAEESPTLQQVFETVRSNRLTTLSIPHVRLPSGERLNDALIPMTPSPHTVSEHTKKVNGKVSLTGLHNIQIQTPPSSSPQQMAELFLQPSLLPPRMLQFSQTPPVATNLRVPKVGQPYHDNYQNQYGNQMTHNTDTLVSAAESLQLYRSISEHQSPLNEVVLQTKSAMTGPFLFRNNPTTANSVTVAASTNISAVAGSFRTASMEMKAQPTTKGTLINTLQPSYISLPHTSSTTPMFAHRKPPTPPPHSLKYYKDWKAEETSSHVTSTSALPSYVRKSLTQNANNTHGAASNDQTARLSQLTNTHKHTHTQDHIHNKIKSKQKQTQKPKQRQKSKQKQSDYEQERVTYTSLGYTSNGEQLFVRHFHERDRLIREHQLKHRICNTFSANNDNFDGDGRGRQTTTQHEETTACLGSPGIRESHESVAVATTKTTSAFVCVPNSTVAGDAANGIAFVNNARTNSNWHGVCHSVDDIVPQVDQDQTERATGTAAVGALAGVRIDDTEAARDDLAQFEEMTTRDNVEISTATDTSFKVMDKCAPNTKVTKERSANVPIAGE